MHCIDRPGRTVALLALIALIALAGCSAPSGDSPGTAPAASPSTASTPITTPRTTGVPAQPSLATPPTASASPARLPAPRSVRNWGEVRLQAAQRMVASDPRGTYTGTVPEVLLAIPVLEIELNGDGSVRRIVVLRPPRQARDTIQLATAAIRRAAPFGDVSRLPKPWKFVETFLFDDDRRFKPRTLEN